MKGTAISSRLGLCAGLLGSLALACVDPSSVVILRNQVPGKGCIISAMPSELSIPDGVLDLTFADKGQNPGYVFTPLVRNGVASVDGQPNARIVFLKGADVEIVAANSTRSQEVVGKLGSVGRATRRFSADVSPNGGTSGLIYQLIDGAQATVLHSLIVKGEAVTVLARTSVFGTMDGSDVESPDFDYPITLCKECLVSIVPCSVIKAEPTALGGECNALQDQPLLCCTEGGMTKCPAVFTPKAP